MSISRRRFFGGSFFGLGAAALNQPNLAESDALFEYIENMPLVPVNSWFNRTYPGWKRSSLDNDIYELWFFRHPQLYFTKAVLEKAIDNLGSVAATNGVHPHFGRHPQELQKDKFGRPKLETTPVALYVQNFHFDRDTDGVEWLLADLKFVKNDVPEEFKKLTTERKQTLLEWMDPKERPQHLPPWPNHKVGNTDTGIDFIPLGCGKISLHERGELEIHNEYHGKKETTKLWGIRFDEYYLLSVSVMSVAPWGDPLRLNWLWRPYDKEGVEYTSRMDYIRKQYELEKENQLEQERRIKQQIEWDKEWEQRQREQALQRDQEDG